MSFRKKRSLLHWLGTAMILTGGLLLFAVLAHSLYAKYWDIRISSIANSLPSPTSEIYGTEPMESPPADQPAQPTAIKAAEATNPANSKEIENKLMPIADPEVKTVPMAKSYPPATRIVIPGIGVDSNVVELGTKRDEKGQLVWETPCHAVGHYEGTANPGENGNIVMAGHISSPLTKCGSVFKRLPEMKPGDVVQLYTEEGVYSYRVTEAQPTFPEDISVMQPTPYARLTLITCYPDWIYTHRWVVIAEPSLGNVPLPPKEEAR